jgi:hypothetical protein
LLFALCSLLFALCSLLFALCSFLFALHLRACFRSLLSRPPTPLSALLRPPFPPLHQAPAVGDWMVNTSLTAGQSGWVNSIVEGQRPCPQDDLDKCQAQKAKGGSGMGGDPNNKEVCWPVGPAVLLPSSCRPPAILLPSSCRPPAVLLPSSCLISSSCRPPCRPSCPFSFGHRSTNPVPPRAAPPVCSGDDGFLSQLPLSVWVASCGPN